MIHASNENPVRDNPRLAGLTGWDADWAGLRVVVAGIGLSGFAAADTLIELGARVVVVDGADTPENRAAMPDADHSRWVGTDALADVVLFLVSDASRAISGAAIPVYGRS